MALYANSAYITQMPLRNVDDDPISLLRRADPPGRPRTSAPRKPPCIRARARQPSEAMDQIISIDLRTTIGKQAKQLRDSLTRHVGGRPNGVQLALIERAIQLKLRVSAMDMSFAATGEMSTHATKAYLAWSNSFTRCLACLGLTSIPAPTESLADVLASVGRLKRAQAAEHTPATVLPYGTPDAAQAAPGPRVVADDGRMPEAAQ